MPAQVPVESGAGHGRAEQQASAEGGAPGAAEGGADRADCPAGHPDGWPACLGHGRLALLGAWSGLSCTVPVRQQCTGHIMPPQCNNEICIVISCLVALTHVHHQMDALQRQRDCICWCRVSEGYQRAEVVREGPCRQSTCCRAALRAFRHQEDAKQWASMARKAAAPSWVYAMAREDFCSLSEGIFNISLSNVAFVALAQMLLGLLPSFAFLWLCNALPAAATVRSWIVQATGAHKLLYSSVHCADACYGV